MNKKTIRDIDVQGKRVLLRMDFNVPLKDGAVTDDTRIRAELPTLDYLLGQGAALLLCSHLGRPKGKVVPEFRMDPVAVRLAELLGRPVKKLDDCVGPEVEAAARAMQPQPCVSLQRSGSSIWIAATWPRSGRRSVRTCPFFSGAAPVSVRAGAIG